jgi:gas vesicle protein
MAVPGFLLGGLAGGLFGGAAAVATRDTSWVEAPRAEWAGAALAPARATPADSTVR